MQRWLSYLFRWYVALTTCPCCGAVSQTFVISDCGSLSPGAVSPGPSTDDLLSTPNTAASARRPLFIYDLVSTGAPTAHSLGFRRGGLLSLQSEIAAAQRDMYNIDEQLKAPALRGRTSQPTNHSSMRQPDIGRRSEHSPCVLVALRAKRPYLLSSLGRVA
jgi:hypothetical protein